MAVGMAMAQQMMQQQGGVLGPQATAPAAGAVPPPLPTQAPAAGTPPPPPAAPAAAVATPELLSPADAAKILGVTEADVLQSLEKGDLKGKKIGSTWRIPKAAIDQFLNS
jgi:excisionase family DNA binding protein